MSKHTPGPWWTDNLYYEAHPSNARTDIIAAAKSDKHSGTKVAEASFSPTPSEYHVDNRKEAEANARLIASAPDLLAALKVFTDFPADVFEGDHDGRYTMTVQLHDMRNARAAIAKAEGAQS
jgi:hypothetical protein